MSVLLGTGYEPSGGYSCHSIWFIFLPLWICPVPRSEFTPDIAVYCVPSIKQDRSPHQKHPQTSSIFQLISFQRTTPDPKSLWGQCPEMAFHWVLVILTPYVLGKVLLCVIGRTWQWLCLGGCNCVSELFKHWGNSAVVWRSKILRFRRLGTLSQALPSSVVYSGKLFDLLEPWLSHL